MSGLSNAERAVPNRDTDAVALVLMDAWERAEDQPVGPTYIATHADMARAVIASNWLAAREAAARQAGREEVVARVDHALCAPDTPDLWRRLRALVAEFAPDATSEAPGNPDSHEWLGMDR